MKTGKFVSNLKPAALKPSGNSIAITDKNNDRKFMFLSEETKPDYRPVSQRLDPLGDQKKVGKDTFLKQVSLFEFQPQLNCVRLFHAFTHALHK
jgi:hypothetical protein